MTGSEAATAAPGFGGALAPLAPIVFVIVATFFVVEVSKKTLPEHRDASLKFLQEFLSRVTIGFLLPLVVFETSFKVTQTLGIVGGLTQAGAALLLGGGLITIAMLIGLAAGRLHEQVSPASLLAFATFGGGNRGLFAMLLLVPILARGQDKASAFLSAFAMVDLGNYLVLLAVTPTLLRWMTRKPEPPEPSEPPRPFDLYRLLVVAGLVLGPLCVFLGAKKDDLVMQLLSGSETFRHAMLSVCALLAIGVSFWRTRTQISQSDAAQLAMTLTSRAVFAFVALVMVSAVAVLEPPGLDFGKVDGGWSAFLASPLPFAVFILLLCPPSSIAPTLLRDAGMPESDIETMERITVYWTLLFMVGAVLMFLGMAAMAAG